MISLRGKVAIITGASSGIGVATSILFSKLGAQLTLTGRKLENLKSTAEKCKNVINASEPEPVIVQGEMCEEQDLKKIVDTTIREFGKIDILVNNAGAMTIGSIENTPVEEYQRMMDVNVKSVFLLTQHAVPHLIKTKGNIVNVSSIGGLRSFPGVVAYCMSKSAVDQLTKVTALELASKQVRCNAVNPGVIVTDLHLRSGEFNDQSYEEFLEKCKQTHPLGRPGHVDEVAKAIAFLASDAASFITATLLPVDGGRQASCPR